MRSLRKEMLKNQICLILSRFLQHAYILALADIYAEPDLGIDPETMVENAANEIMRLLEEK